VTLPRVTSAPQRRLREGLPIEGPSVKGDPEKGKGELFSLDGSDAPQKNGKAKRKPKAVPADPMTGIEFPAHMDTPAVREATSAWLKHHVAIGKPYKSPPTQMALLFKQHPTPEGFVADVEYSIGNNYQGLIHAKGNHGNSSKVDCGPGQRHPDDVKGIGQF